MNERETLRETNEVLRKNCHWALDALSDAENELERIQMQYDLPRRIARKLARAALAALKKLRREEKPEPWVWPPEGYELSEEPPEDGELVWIESTYNTETRETELRYWRRTKGAV